MFAGWIITKAAHTCFIDARHWNAKAMSELSRIDTLKPYRGDILASDGRIMATDIVLYHVLIDFKASKFDKDTIFLKELPALSEALARKFPNKTAKQYNKDIRKAYERRDKNRNYVLVRDVFDKDFQEIKTFPFFNHKRYQREFASHTGLHICRPEDAKIQRLKPFGSMASRAIGNVDENQCGSSGLEKSFDNLLKGKPGQRVKKQVTSGIIGWEETPPTRGVDVKTTLDIDIQDITEQSLLDMIKPINAQFGVAVVMEVATGDIKAMSNLTRTSNGDYYEGTNEAVRAYEPGSTVKALSMMIALDKGIVRPHDLVNVHNGRFPFPANKPITDTHPRAQITAEQCIWYSSNIGLSVITLKGFGDNPDGFVKEIERIGFTDPLNLHIPGAVIPQIRHLKNNLEGKIDLTRMSYGYSTAIPPIYILALYNTIANNGKFVRPRLVKELIKEGKTDSIFNTEYIREQMCKPETAQALQKMLFGVVFEEGGTARAVRSDKVKIAGKTGTAKVSRGKEGYSGYRITFCGFFPAENPQYSCVVTISEPDLPGMPSAARYSGGVLKSIAEKMFAMGLLDTHLEIKRDTVRPFEPRIKTGSEEATYTVCKNLGLIYDKEQQNIQHDLDKTYTFVPNVTNMGAKDALYILEKSGLKVGLKGKGKVKTQSIPPGTAIRKGQKIWITLEI